MAEKDQLEAIEKRLIEMELRLSRLEGSAKIPSIPPEKKRPKIPISAFIALAIGGYILLSTVPRFLFGFGYYGSGRTDIFSLLVILGGLVLAGWGVKTIHESRQKMATQTPEAGKAEAFKLAIPKFGQTPTEKPESAQEEQSFEFKIASHWFSIVGIAAIVLGVVFFLKFAFDNNLIGPVGQVSIGIFFGLVLLGAGEYFRAKYEKYSQIITGGGIIVLYLSLWAAFALFGLVNAEITLGAMSLVTLVAALLSVRYGAIYISALGIIGGFATPMMLVRGFDNQLLLMSYVVILDLGVLGMAIFQNWRKLNILAFASTYLVFAGWYGTYYTPDKLWPTMFFVTLLFLIFGFVLFIYNVVNKVNIEDTDIFLMLVNVAV